MHQLIDYSQRGHDDFKTDFTKNISWLKKSLKAFEDGDSSEAERMIPPLRTLFHNGKNQQSQSIFRRLNLENNLFPDTAFSSDQNTVAFCDLGDVPVKYNHITLGTKGIPYLGLVGKKFYGMEGELKAKYLPLFQMKVFSYRPNFKSFLPWWEQVIFDNRKGLLLSRKELILCLGEQDGVLHSDHKIKNKYLALKKKDAIPLTINFKTKVDFENFPTLSSVAQITFEVLNMAEQIIL